ncbi:MAG: multifunctional oxoglutarate decarboxylase/oxoglutarate dehydrogenase thiamine pyrophosphate-binding subunit/dihydrolipoyllysine-residue succinyltransferase subunit [Bacteroidetes bacterium]|nr:multifunctional oxoglutarate decarboxylase/oxoglutarate dehydrogenase thiamine pyrophosphate-binding subunit/dihydrolipoyllysine-residue succinyltransferase subunit [Bacteroidota bacterium]
MLGFNTGYIEELYTQYLSDPSSVSESWQDFFKDYRPSESYKAAAMVRAARESNAAAEAEVTPQQSAGSGNGTAVKSAPAAPAPPKDAELVAMRGPTAKIAENMEASLRVPTATSVRTIPVKLLAENRNLINDYQKYVGGAKVSFTHVIAFALVRALREFPDMNVAYAEEEGTPYLVRHQHVNLGLAIDIERRGRRSLLVPNIKEAEKLTFPQFLGLYNDLIVRARNNKLALEDFADTTASITNPGMIGTSLSVPRLMEGQGLIVGVGSITYPPDYHAFAPDVISRAGISQVMTITSTYDHRVIQGAESGAFLARVGELLLGEHKFYESIFEDLGIQHQPYVLTLDNTPSIGSDEDTQTGMIRKQARVLQLIRAYRVRGHLQSDINPLGTAWEYHPELDPATYGLTIWDLDRKFDCGGLAGKSMLTLRQILDVLRGTYSRKVGIEYMHISDPVEKSWLQDRMEAEASGQVLSGDTKKRILAKLNGAEAFERFLHTKYIGHKRFSLEGAETVIPMLDVMLTEAAEQGVTEVVMGMAHRGRLNVLANVLQKPYSVLFSEFEGSIDPTTIQGSGDVKYHLGARGVHEAPDGKSVDVTLASNPSHLEAVNPVVEGMVRAKQQLRARERKEAPEGDYSDSVIPLLIHGDAAFAGQGVVAETLNLSQLPGYHTGGTLHVVINNQIGFTTTPADARSSTYATDVARMIQAPIFHVNGNDPEECVRVARMAFDYRQVFNKDVVIDMLCYRVHGHNEGDEPTYTQPLLYKRIEEMRSVRLLYTEALLSRGDLKPEEAEQMLDDYRARLQTAFDETKELAEKDPENVLARLRQRVESQKVEYVDGTAVGEDVLSAVTGAIHKIPSWFNAHPKLVRQFDRRLSGYNSDGKIDWGFGEALAFGSLLLEGTTVRLAGQDSQRGTFSHRHAVLSDQVTGEEYIPLNHIREGQADLYIYDSLLSEYAACGFEYGYSVGDPEALVIWEAQFGDFANGAQIVFDQFLSAAEAKWGQQSGLVLLLPHGYEGQGPEHSSARLERFLQLCAGSNMLVCNFTTPANLFHGLRSQVRRKSRKPMVIMSPKSLLRHPMAVSLPQDFTAGRFMRVYPAEPVVPDEQVERVLFASGKVAYDLMQAAAEAKSKVAIVRVEQLYPFPEEDIVAQLDRFTSATSVAWVQEEPANMGAWQSVRWRFDDVLSARSSDPCARIEYVGRRESASPSTGSAKVHQVEQEELLNKALMLG